MSINELEIISNYLTHLPSTPKPRSCMAFNKKSPIQMKTVLEDKT